MEMHWQSIALQSILHIISSSCVSLCVCVCVCVCLYYYEDIVFTNHRSCRKTETFWFGFVLAVIVVVVDGYYLLNFECYYVHVAGIAYALISSSYTQPPASRYTYHIDKLITSNSLKQFCNCFALLQLTLHRDKELLQNFVPNLVSLNKDMDLTSIHSICVFSKLDSIVNIYIWTERFPTAICIL